MSSTSTLTIFAYQAAGKTVRHVSRNGALDPSAAQSLADGLASRVTVYEVDFDAEGNGVLRFVRFVSPSAAAVRLSALPIPRQG